MESAGNFGFWVISSHSKHIWKKVTMGWISAIRHPWAMHVSKNSGKWWFQCCLPPKLSSPNCSALKIDVRTYLICMQRKSRSWSTSNGTSAWAHATVWRPYKTIGRRLSTKMHIICVINHLEGMTQQSSYDQPRSYNHNLWSLIWFLHSENSENEYFKLHVSNFYWLSNSSMGSPMRCASFDTWCHHNHLLVLHVQCTPLHLRPNLPCSFSWWPQNECFSTT